MHVAQPTRFRFTRLLLATTALAGTALAQPAPAEPEEQSQDVVTLPEFSVNTSKDDSFVATESTSGTRVATDIINLPYSVSVLTEDFVKEFQLFDIEQQAPFFSGMAGGDPAAGTGGTRLRGFSVPYFRNGFYRTQAPESNSIARTEVVKGPQSAIYGRVSPGGVVNYIAKRPGTKFSSGLSYVVGTYDYERISGDITGPLIPGKLYYRVDVAELNHERSTDFWYNRTTNISGSIVYKISDSTQVTFEHEYAKKRMQGGQAFVRWQRYEPQTTGSPIAITKGLAYYMDDQELGRRLTQFSSNGAFSRVNRSSESTYLTLEHRLSPDLSMRANVAYTTRAHYRHGTSTPSVWNITPTSAQQTVLTSLDGIWTYTDRGIWSAAREGAHTETDYEEKGIQIDITKKWNTRWRQRSLLTFDVFYQDQFQTNWALRSTALTTALTDLGMTTTAQQNAWKYPDPFNPDVSGYYPVPTFDEATWLKTSTNYFDRFYYGSLLNHTIDFMNGRLSWTGSVRKDWGEFQVAEDQGNVQKATYSTGLNFHVINRALVAYGNVATGFNPAPQFDPNVGELLGNLESRGGEIGFKGLLKNDTFSYTLGIYDVKQDNEVTDNPDNPDNDMELPRYIAGASTRARGINLDLSGKVTRNFTVLANVAWTDVKIVKHRSVPSLVGTPPTGAQGVPPRTYAVAARYNFREGILKGLRVGATYQYAQEYLRSAASYNANGVMTAFPYNVAERQEWSAVIGYAFKKFRHGERLDMSVNITNLLDSDTLTSAGYFPEGRTFRFTTTLRF